MYTWTGRCRLLSSANIDDRQFACHGVSRRRRDKQTLMSLLLLQLQVFVQKDVFLTFACD